MNNNNNLEKFIEEIESIKMTQYEKNEMRQHLSAFAMNYKPNISPYASILLVSKKILASAFIAIISIGSLSQFASNDALPGDTLYPVKIAHEKIRLATTNGEARKINFEIKQTEKRIQEATQLAQEEKLDTEAQEEIAKVIKVLTQKVKDHIEDVKVNNPESALILNSELKSTIKANSEVLRKVTTQKTRRRREIAPIEKISEINKVEEINTENEQELNLDIPDLDEINSLENEYNNILDEEIRLNENIEDVISDNEEYEEVEISLAESLLDSLDEEIYQIEAIEDAVEKQITEGELQEEDQKETETIDEIEAETKQITEPEDAAEKQINEEELQEEDQKETETIDEIEAERSPEDQKVIDLESSNLLNKEIRSLHDIIKIKEDIAAIKLISETVLDTLATKNETGENIFDEKSVRESAEILIKDKKYKRAFVELQSILEYHRQKNIKNNTKKKLGIDQDNPIEEIPIQ
jgi:chromosome segregation ATPase